ncbi:MAG: hypothetical protein ABIH89_02030 [Elusimicrobiota bacterium]
MMRRSTKRFLFFILILTVFPVFFLFFKHVPDHNLRACRDFFEYIPEKAGKKQLLAVICLGNPADIYDRIQNTGFHGALVKSPLWKHEKTEKLQKLSLPDAKPGVTSTILKILNNNMLIAVYGSEYDKLEYALITKVKGVPGVKALAGSVMEWENTVQETYRDIHINSLAENLCFSLSGNLIVVTSSIELHKAVIDMKTGYEDAGDINSGYPEAAGKIDVSADCFIFLSNRELHAVLSGVLREFTGIHVDFRDPGSQKTCHNILFDRGLVIRSLLRDSTARKPEEDSAAPVSVGFLPGHILMAGISTRYEPEELSDSLERSAYGILGYLDIDVKKDVIPDLSGGEAGYAILGPSRDIVGSALPGLIIFGQVKNRESIDRLTGVFKDSLNSDVKEMEYSGTKYLVAEIDLFMGQKAEICLLSMQLKKKQFVVVATSGKIVRDVIDHASGKKEGFIRSPEWREISRFLPDEFSVFSYADVNALSGTVGLFIAAISGNSRLEAFLKTAPFSWIGPAGSASIFSDEEIEIYSYFPVQDLNQDSWTVILESLEGLIKKNE